MKLALILATLTSLLSSCTLTIAPDGTRSYSLDAPVAIQAVQLLTHDK